MADPTISSISPNKGATGGQGLVEIHGTGFRLPPTPALTNGETPAPPPSVRVFFGQEEARRVRIISEERLIVVTPAHNKGVVTLEVRNVGDYGETLGQVATMASAFTFIMPDLTKDTAIVHIIRRLHSELARQVLPEVFTTQSVDWSDTPDSALRKVTSAKVPSVILAGPRLRENLNYRTNLLSQKQVGTETYEFRPPRVVDLIFTLGAIAESMVNMLGLCQALTNFMTRNLWLEVPREQTDPTRASVRYEIGFEPDGDMTVSTDPSKSDLKSCAGTISIKGVFLEGLNIEGDMGVDVQPQMTEPPRLTSTPRGGA